uniref:Uncharacterized protein n=1 Tax=Octopus bimaculoides TaxID=37653 RepID=A0A0L8G2F1_OCTBM
MSPEVTMAHEPSSSDKECDSTLDCYALDLPTPVNISNISTSSATTTMTTTTNTTNITTSTTITNAITTNTTSTATTTTSATTTAAAPHINTEALADSDQWSVLNMDVQKDTEGSEETEDNVQLVAVNASVVQQDHRFIERRSYSSNGRVIRKRRSTTKRTLSMQDTPMYLVEQYTITTIRVS